MELKNEKDSLKEQLNLLIALLNVSDEKIFDLIKNKNQLVNNTNIGELYNNDYNSYRDHVTISAFILGFTHFEHFLTTLIKKIYCLNPRKYKLKFSLEDIKGFNNDVIEKVAYEKASGLKLVDKIEFLKNKFKNIDSALFTKLTYLRKVRNCLMHSNGIASEHLNPKFKKGDKIIFTKNEINEFGIVARGLADKLWQEYGKLKNEYKPSFMVVRTNKMSNKLN